MVFAHEIHANISFETGTSTNARIVDVIGVAEYFRPVLCNAILGLYVFTGCDCVSAFKGKGKSKGLKILKADDAICETFQILGSTN